MPRKLTLLLGALGLITTLTPIYAACTVTMPSLSFGLYDALSAAPVTTSGNAVINCNDNPPPLVTVQLGPSTVSGGFFPRRMRAATGGDRLDYNFYADPSGASVFGDGTGGTVTRSSKVNRNVPWSVTFYGRIAPSQDVAPGIYSDTLTITINF